MASQRQGRFVVDTIVRADCHRQYITYAPFIGPSTRSVFDGDRVVIESSDGRELQRRENPRAAFAGHTRMTPWDDLHLAYFTGYAMWNYLTVPFLFTWPGFRCAEIEPRQEDGELWRRLKVTFPPHIATHCPEQVFYFDSNGLLRRLEYQAEVAGGLPVAHYVSGHVTIEGIAVPHHRRVLPRGSDGHVDRRAPPLVAIDLTAVQVA